MDRSPRALRDLQLLLDLRNGTAYTCDEDVNDRRTYSTLRAMGTASQRAVQEEVPTEKHAYEPLSSIWEGSDAELIERMLTFYPRSTPTRILDATVNGGRFWRESTRPVTGIDVHGKHRPDVVADNTQMPFAAGTFDVVVYDPPHIPNQGTDKSKDFNSRFGLVIRSSKENKYTFTHTFSPFLKEAVSVLRDEGILLCKLTDYIHHHQYQWAHVEFIEAAKRVGLKACDCIIKIRNGPIIDPKWKTAHHSRRRHSYWLIFRKSKKCE